MLCDDHFIQHPVGRNYHDITDDRGHKPLNTPFISHIRHSQQIRLTLRNLYFKNPLLVRDSSANQRRIRYRQQRNCSILHRNFLIIQHSPTEHLSRSIQRDDQQQNQ